MGAVGPATSGALGQSTSRSIGAEREPVYPKKREVPKLSTDATPFNKRLTTTALIMMGLKNCPSDSGEARTATNQLGSPLEKSRNS